MPTQRRGLGGLMRLVATDGHSHWAEPEVRVFTGLVPGHDGYGVGVDCTFADHPMTHWIGRDFWGRAQWQTTPYSFRTLADAKAARDELAAQQQGEGE